MNSHEKISRLVESIKSGESAAHAYIIEGRQGEARDEAVNEVITAVIGDKPNAAIMDVVRMSASGKQGYKTSDASDFIKRISMDAYGDCIVGIIDNAELMSEIVQNKLLKTLEEPEPGTIIILAASNADKLIPTVLSRCVLIKLGDESDSEYTDNGLFNKGNFYKYRESIEKNIKSRDDAVIFLGQLEDSKSREMLQGKMLKENAYNIELIEKARMDIYNGMSYSKALKRLFLELA